MSSGASFAFRSSIGYEQTIERLSRPATVLENIRRFFSFSEALVYSARQAAQTAESHRHFPVGAAALCYRWEADLGIQWRTFCGSNLKPKADLRTVCAEPIAVMSAHAAGWQDIIGLALVGDLQTDEVSGLVTPTLHPCFNCRSSLSVLPGVKPWTLVLTAHLEDDGIYELHSMKRLLRRHGTEFPAHWR